MTEQRDAACCFTGHRKIPSEKLPELVHKLEIELKWLVSHGITEFYAGGALGFDTIAELVVLKMKRQNQPVHLHLELPCPDQCRYWSPNEIAAYKGIMELADSVSYCSDHYYSGVMHVRNRAMVDKSAYCVCYYDRDVASAGGKPPSGGTLYTVNYARRMGLSLINLCDEPPDDGQLEFSYL